MADSLKAGLRAVYRERCQSSAGRELSQCFSAGWRLLTGAGNKTNTVHAGDDWHSSSEVMRQCWGEGLLSPAGTGDLQWCVLMFSGCWTGDRCLLPRDVGFGHSLALVVGHKRKMRHSKYFRRQRIEKALLFNSYSL